MTRSFSWLDPAAPRRTVLVGMVALFAAVVITPLIGHPAYSPVQHSLATLGGQGMPWSSLMRVGYAAFGTAWVIVALSLWFERRIMAGAIGVFGVAMIGAAMFQAAPVVPMAGVSAFAASLNAGLVMLMLVGLAAAAAARLARERFAPGDVAGWVTLVVVVGAPLAMATWPGLTGVFDRIVLAAAFWWIWTEVSGPLR